MSIQVDIVGPESLVVSQTADMVVLPGIEGDIAAMPNHAPVNLIMRGGVVDIYVAGNRSERYFVTGGVAEINVSSCTALVDEIWKLSELSLVEGEHRLAEARAQLENISVSDYEKVEHLQRKLLTAMAWVEIFSSS